MSDNQKGTVVDFTDDPQASTFGLNADGKIINGDLSDSANAHRCRLVPRVVEERDHAAAFFDDAFRRHWGQEFCLR